MVSLIRRPVLNKSVSRVTSSIVTAFSRSMLFFTEGPLSDEYASYLQDLSVIITPTIVLYEVYKKIKRERTEEEALIATALIKRTSIIPLTESTSLFAADLSLKYSLPMADAIVYAVAVESDCRIVTSDAHFKELEGVMFLSR